MDERYAKQRALKERLKEDFETKHETFLAELEKMPMGTKEEKEERWNFLEAYPLHDDFKIETMQAYRSGAYRRFVNRVRDSSKAWGQDADIASAWNKQDIDGAAFMEAMHEAVCNYRKSDKNEEDYNFLSYLGMKYGQMAAESAATNEIAKSGMIPISEMPRSNRQRIIKLVRKVNEFRGKSWTQDSLEKILETCAEDSDYRKAYTKREKQLAYELLMNPCNISLDEILTGEDGQENTALLDRLGKNGLSGTDVCQEIVEREEKTSFLEIFCQNIEEGWDTIKAARGLRQQEKIKIFFTRDVLKVLKLDESGKPFPKEPAGNEDIYQSLEPRGEFLHHTVFYKRYLIRALVEEPGNFYEVYAKLLREDFDFTDKILAESAGKDRGTISRWRSDYIELMKCLYHYYVNES